MSQYLDFLDKVARELGIPVAEARAIYQNESSSGRNVRASSAGAQGHMQLMPGTAREMGVKNIHDPYENIRGGLTYYAQQRKRFGDPALAAAAYNAGPGRVQQAGNRVPRIGETQDYVAKFLRQIGRVKPAQAAPAVPPQTAPLAQQGTMDEDTEQMTGGLGGTSAKPLEDDLGALQAELIALPKKLETMRGEQFKAAEARINQRYAAPSTSDMLFALSQALLSPRRYRGFGGTMYNVSQALGGLNDREEKARQAREDALFNLQQQTAAGKFEDQAEALKLRVQVAKEQAEAEEAARKAALPKYQYDATEGRWVIQPGTGGTPHLATADIPVLTPEQVAAASRDPANRGREFKTTDGRVMRIK